MNKDDLLRLINSLGLPKDEYYILSSGSLVIYGLRKIANDLDLCVTPILFNTLSKKYRLINPNAYGFYQLNYFIEVRVNQKEDFKMTLRDGYPVETLDSILTFKKKRLNANDIIDISKIEEYQKKN